MPWIRVIREDEAQGELREVYRKIKEQRKGKKGDMNLVTPPRIA